MNTNAVLDSVRMSLRPPACKPGVMSTSIRSLLATTFGTFLVASSALFSPAAHAQSHPHPMPAPSAPADLSDAAASPWTEGEVRKIDKPAGKLTLRHGPIRNLDMGGMTMVFKVVDEKLLDTLTEGDKIRFTAERIDGALTLTKVEPAR